MDDTKLSLDGMDMQRRSLLQLGGGLIGGMAAALPFAAAPALAAAAPSLIGAEGLRVVVAANNAKGKSYIFKDEIIKRGSRPLIWQHTAQDAMGVAGPNDLKTLLPASIPAIDPPVGAAEWRFATIGPSKKKKGEPLVRKPGKDGFHITTTIDYDIFLQGGMTMFLDEGEVELNAGDVVIIRNASHAWMNYTDQPISFLAMLVRV